MEAARLLADLVAIDSVNPALVPGAAGEREIATYAAISASPAAPGTSAGLTESIATRAASSPAAPIAAAVRALG